MEELLRKSRKASFELSRLSSMEKNEALSRIRDALIENKEYIISENKLDCINALALGLKDSMIDRLSLNEKRIDSIAKSIDEIIALDDPIGEVIDAVVRPSGIRIEKTRVPFGVVASVFEARPNVAVDIAVLCLKTSNASVLKGGKEAINTNRALVSIMRKAIGGIVDENAITLIDDISREATEELITSKGYIDLLIPRGGKGLIKFITENAKVPYIETGAGNCHLYVHESADIEKSIKVAVNAKYQRPSVCNAIENIIVDRNIKDGFLPRLYSEFDRLNIEMRGDKETLGVIDVKEATDEDYYTEYNDYIVSIKVVGGIDEAISHINSHSSKHSETIMAEDRDAAEKFMNEIDSACVYHNASTRFSDGGEFGFGAEIGISTSKLHARGPMGLKEITTYKYKIYGNGEVRK